MSFNLVIEVLFISRESRILARHTTRMFQSRNRGSFDFKREKHVRSTFFAGFQSRNRGSFDFKNCEPLGIHL